jgi:hypothetical protein
LSGSRPPPRSPFNKYSSDCTSLVFNNILALNMAVHHRTSRRVLLRAGFDTDHFIAEMTFQGELRQNTGTTAAYVNVCAAATQIPSGR